MSELSDTHQNEEEQEQGTFTRGDVRVVKRAMTTALGLTAANVFIALVQIYAKKYGDNKIEAAHKAKFLTANPTALTADNVTLPFRVRMAPGLIMTFMHVAVFIILSIAVWWGGGSDKFKDLRTASFVTALIPMLPFFLAIILSCGILIFFIGLLAFMVLFGAGGESGALFIGGTSGSGGADSSSTFGDFMGWLGNQIGYSWKFYAASGVFFVILTGLLVEAYKELDTVADNTVDNDETSDQS